MASCQPIATTPAEQPEQPQAAAPAPTTESQVAAPSSQSAVVVRTGCSATTDEPLQIGVRFAATGSAKVDEGVRIITKFAWEGHLVPELPELLDREIAQRKTGGPPSVDWEATLSTSLEVDEIPASRVLHVTAVVLAYTSAETMRSGPGTELARSEFTCTLPEAQKPTIEIVSLDCVPIDRNKEGTVYEIRAYGRAYGPHGAQALFTNLTDIDPPGSFSPESLKADWQEVGQPVPNGMQRDPSTSDPASTQFAFVSRSVPVPEGQGRTAIGRAALRLDDGQSGIISEKRVPCDDTQRADLGGGTGGAGLTQPTSTPSPKPEPSPTPTRPAVTPAPTQVPTPSRANTPPFQFSAPATLPQAEAGKPYRPNDQPYSFCDPRVTGPTEPCPPPGLPARNPSGGSPPYHFQLGTAGGFPPIGMSLGKDGQLTGVPDPGTGGKTYHFVVCAVDLSADPVCREVSITVAAAPTPTPVPTLTPTSTPKPTATPTPKPTATPIPEIAVEIQSLTCSYRLVKEQTGNFGYREYLFSVDASGTASGPVDTNLSVTLKGLSNNAYTTTLTGDWTRTGSIARRRGPSDPYAANWTLHGEYDQVFLAGTAETERATLKVFVGSKTAEKTITCK